MKNSTLFQLDLGGLDASSIETHSQLDHGYAPTKPAITHMCYQQLPLAISIADRLFSSHLILFHPAMAANLARALPLQRLCKRHDLSRKQSANLNRCWGD